MAREHKDSKSFDEMKYTKKYETGKAIKQKVSKSHFSGIRGIKKHETVMVKRRKIGIVLMK